MTSTTVASVKFPSDGRKSSSISFPKPIRHFHSLRDGRLLAYNTFATGREEKKETNNLHPVIYFHGFPGTGMEGTVFARVETQYKCKVYGIDRPGFGSSSQPRPNDVSPIEYMEHFMDDVFDFIKAQKWAHYSVIGLSGGGPYALAFLDRYLKQPKEQRTKQQLTAVAMVAGVCSAAGAAGMMDTNKTLINYVNSNSWWKLLVLKIMLIVQCFMVRWLPMKWLSEGLFSQLPTVDRNCLYANNSEGLNMLLEVMKNALQQGYYAPYTEMQFLFSNRDQPYHRSLRERYLFLQGGSSDDTTSPKIIIFQGLKDVNVPSSHSRYVYENILNGPEHTDSITYKQYTDMGHISIAIMKAADVMQAVAAPSELQK